jgi:hypothetical protein
MWESLWGNLRCSSVEARCQNRAACVGPELLSNVVDKRIELGGGLIETNSIFEDDSLNEVGE